MDHVHATHRFVKGSEFDADLFGHTPDTVQPRYPESPGFKAGGTSAEAALKIAPLAGRLIKPILQEFVAASPTGLTADQCAKRIGVSVLSMRPRISELKRLGFLSLTGDRAENDSGMTASVLRATPKASEVLS
jgi:hypothetical protein